MNTEERVDRLISRLSRINLITPAITLYAEGVKTKIRQVYFSLDQLKKLEHIEDDPGLQVSSTSPNTYLIQNTSEQVILYCDCFWDFLRSSLDILGQLINQIRSLNIDEKQLDIKVVSRKLDETEQNSLLDRTIKKCINSRKFKILEAYRHCSIHRRPVYVETQTTTMRITGTPGYYTAGSQSPVVDRYLCINPEDLNPTIGNCERPLVTFCVSMLSSIEDHIASILYNLR